MPYGSITELPPPVRERYSDRCQRVFVKAYNNAADRGMDETARMKVAHTAAGMCKDAGKSADEFAEFDALKDLLKNEADEETPMKAVKFVEGSDSLIEGLAIPFGGPFAGKDIDGEDFGPDTDFAFDLFPTGRPVLYDHGTDETMKTTVQGRQIEYEVRDEGVWARAQLDRSAKYHATVKRLIDNGTLYFSSGSAPQMAAKNADGHITRWPWLELSLTPIPANPSARAYSVKMADLVQHAETAKVDVSSGLIAEALRALDNALTTDDDALPDGVKFADMVDRLTVDGPAWVKARRDWYAKSGRVLSAATRERLANHPQSLRQLADDLDELLASADAGKSALVAALIEAEATKARALGVPIPN